MLACLTREEMGSLLTSIANDAKMAFLTCARSFRSAAAGTNATGMMVGKPKALRTARDAKPAASVIAAPESPGNASRITCNVRQAQMKLSKQQADESRGVGFTLLRGRVP